MSVGSDAVNVNPRLSVIVATTRCWPTADVCLRELAPQTRAMGAELILRHGHGSRLDAALFPHVVRLGRPSADRLTPHADPCAVPHGDVTTTSDDHVRPA